MGQQIVVNHLERHDAVHEAMPGLEDLAHAAFAQRRQQAVLAPHQLAMPSELKLLGLVRSEPTPLHQLPHQSPGVSSLGPKFVHQLVHLARCQELAIAEYLDDSGDGVQSRDDASQGKWLDTGNQRPPSVIIVLQDRPNNVGRSLRPDVLDQNTG